MNLTLVYSVLIPHVIFFLLDSVLIIHSIEQGVQTKTERAFLWFLLLATLLEVETFVDYGCDFGAFSIGFTAQYILNGLGNMLIILISYTYTHYLILSSPELRSANGLPVQIICTIPALIQLVMCVLTPWTHWLFYIDENGTYQSGSMSFLAYLPYLYFVLALVLTAIRFFKTENRSNTIKRFVLFIVPAAVGGVLNTNGIRGGYSQIGFSVGAILLYLDEYMVEINENKRLKSIEELNKQLLLVNEELKAAQEAADRANHAKTQFLFNMSHDIRTPMNAILGYTDIALAHYKDEEKTKESLNKIKTSGNHLLNLINDILEMSRIEAGKLYITEAPIDMRRAVGTVNNMSQALALTKHIEMEVLQGEITNPYIYADELHMNEVFVNLISNAVKYTPQGGHVTYRIEQEGKVKDGRASFKFEINDNGIGMSEEFQSHLFEAFRREKDNSVAKVEGTGLGLSIVKNILDLTGGTITCRSKKNAGTTFTVRLSFRIMEPEAIEKLEEELSRSVIDTVKKEISLRGKRVLYAEDNDINREICEEILTEAGITVDSAENGLIAVEKMRSHETGYYDTVLMDIQMPVMNGYEATVEIRKLPQGQTVPIIALSANAFAEDIAQAKAAGMDAHIAKPIDIKKLFETLRDLV